MSVIEDYNRLLAEKEAEIERLRKTLDDHLDSEAAETRRADRERDRARTAEAEIERLRGLLRETHLALSFMPDPTRKLLDLRYRVREALGDER